MPVSFALFKDLVFAPAGVERSGFGDWFVFAGSRLNRLSLLLTINRSVVHNLGGKNSPFHCDSLSELRNNSLRGQWVSSGITGQVRGDGGFSIMVHPTKAYLDW